MVNNNNTVSSNKNIFTVVPYTRGLSEKFKRICNSLGIQVHFKGNNTIQTLVMDPKDNIFQKSGVIYWYKCSHTDCPEQYIGESGRTFGDRFKELLRAPSFIHQHSQSTGHSADLECFTIIDREAQGATRTIKEAMYVWVNDPSLNRNLGKYICPTYGMRYYRNAPSLWLK